jgi:hypothetical protein
MQVIDETAAVLSALGALTRVTLEERLEGSAIQVEAKTMSKTLKDSRTYPMFPIMVW